MGNVSEGFIALPVSLPMALGTAIGALQGLKLRHVVCMSFSSLSPWTPNQLTT